MLKPHVHNFLNIFCWFKAWWFQVALLSRILYPRSLVWYWTGFSLFGGNKREMGHQKIPVCSPMLGRWPGLCVAAGQPLRLSLRQLLFSVRFAEGFWPGVAFLYGGFCHLSILELSWFFLMSLSPPHWIIFARKFYSRGGVAVPPFSGANRQDGVKFVWNIWAP